MSRRSPTWQNYRASIYLDDARYYLGMAQFHQALYPEARAAFERVLLTQGSNFTDNVNYHIGRCYFEEGDLVAAAAQLAAMRRSFPHSSFADNAHYYLGRCAFDSGDYAAALTELAKVATDTSTRATARRLGRSSGCCRAAFQPAATAAGRSPMPPAAAAEAAHCPCAAAPIDKLHYLFT